MSTRLNLEDARRRDHADELASFRDRFVHAEPELIYLLGNSLGRLPRATTAYLHNLIQDEWGTRLIRGWNEGWIDLPQQIGDQIADLVGARQGEVLLADSTSVNLYKLATAALRARPGRHKIVTDDLNFPSDLYVLQGAIAAAGGSHQLVIVPSKDGIHGPAEALNDALDDDTALLTLSHTVFKSAYTYDMAALTHRAHQAGALVLWDVSHSAGALPLHFESDGVDLAVGCTYKYLNGGPGAPAFLYVRRALQTELNNPISGWMGQDQPFDFDLDYRPAPGLRRFLTGTPSILSLAAIEKGVELLREAGMVRVRAKSVQQTTYLLDLWHHYLRPLGFELRSPREAAERGSHVALGHAEARRIAQILKETGRLILDFRHPDNLRLAIAPLYNSYADLYHAVQRLRHAVSERTYEGVETRDSIIT